MSTSHVGNSGVEAPAPVRGGALVAPVPLCNGAGTVGNGAGNCAGSFCVLLAPVTRGVCAVTGACSAPVILSLYAALIFFEASQ